MKRWPALILVLAMIGGLLVLEQRSSASSSDIVDATSVPVSGPLAAAPDASGTTWYCPAGFTTPDGTNDHVIIVSNATDASADGTLTLFPSLIDVDGNSITFPRAAQPVTVEPNSQQEISLAPLVPSLDPALATNTGAFVAALVEFDDAGLTVEHRVIASRGSDLGPCATSAASSWWFASGTTTADVGYQLYLLNPFPDEAVVDISFVGDAGSRSPTAFSGRLIPAQSLTVLQVSPAVPVNAQTTAQVTVLTGRVIAERIQLFDNEAGPNGVSLSLGSNRLSDQWFFPAGRAVPGAGESYVIYNPGDEPAEVEFELKPDSADRIGDIAPLAVPVGARERWIVTVASTPSHPVDSLAVIDARTMVGPGEPYFVSIRSFNGVPVVAERLLTRPVGEGGLSASLGIDVASTNQSFTIPTAIETAERAVLAVLNPAGDTISRVEIVAGDAAGESLRATVELAPRRRGVFDLLSLVQPGDEWIRVRSSAGVMAEVVITGDGVVLSTSGIPVQGTTSIPDLLAFD